MRQLYFCKQQLLGLLVYGCLASSGLCGSFLDWIDDTNCDNSLVNGRSFILQTDYSNGFQMSFTSMPGGLPGEAFVYVFDKLAGRMSHTLICINGQNGKIYTNHLESIPNNAKMQGLVTITNNEHRILHFLEESDSYEPPKSDTIVELDDKYKIVSIRKIRGEDGDWEKYSGSNPNNMSDLGIYYYSSWASPSSTGQISWPKGSVTVLFGATDYPPQPKMYVFHEDNFLGVRKLALMPLGSIVFIKSNKQVLLKAWFGVESRAAGTDQPDSKRPIATTTWALDADSISRAFITSGRWLMIDGRRGDKEVIFFYNMSEILNQAAKKSASDAYANW
jgi:hypothetical protein